jgi:hypothetical protein
MYVSRVDAWPRSWWFDQQPLGAVGGGEIAASFHRCAAARWGAAAHDERIAAAQQKCAVTERAGARAGRGA